MGNLAKTLFFNTTHDSFHDSKHILLNLRRLDRICDALFVCQQHSVFYRKVDSPIMRNRFFCLPTAIKSKCYSAFLLFVRHFHSKCFLLIVSSLDRKCDALFTLLMCILFFYTADLKTIILRWSIVGIFLNRTMPISLRIYVIIHCLRYIIISAKSRRNI